MPNDEVTLSVELENIEDVNALGGYLTLPNGVSVVDMVPNPTRCSNHSVSFRKQIDNRYRFLLISINNNSIYENSGEVIHVKLKIDGTVNAGTYDIKLSGLELSTTDNISVLVNDYAGRLKVGKYDYSNCTLNVLGAGGRVGGEAVVMVTLTNDLPIYDLEFKLTLPDGFIYKNARQTERSVDHAVSCRFRNDSYRVEAVTLTDTPFMDSEGVIMELLFRTDRDLRPGEYDLKISDIILYDAGGKEIKVGDFTASVTLSTRRILLDDITDLIDEYLLQGRIGE